MDSPEFIIWAPSYNENVGGIIVLHALCARLNYLGASAVLWPFWKPTERKVRWDVLRCYLGYLGRGRFLRFRKGPYSNSTARFGDQHRSIVIYPEIVSGNPLSAERVVRWLLCKPGFHGGPRSFDKDDLVFAYNPAFRSDLEKAPDPLRVTHLNPVYRQVNFGPREGACYLVRKGKDRVLDCHPPDAVLVDQMSHAERAAIFNRTEYLYCYDPYTFYAQYAALCGCVPIVIPDEGTGEEEWEPLPDRRLGIAYGESRIEWARNTRDALRESLAQRRLEEDATIERFIAECREHFGTHVVRTSNKIVSDGLPACQENDAQKRYGK